MSVPAVARDGNDFDALASAMPAGKTARDEDFPVGSLLPAKLRPLVASFYCVARRADDIADSPSLSPEAKLAALDALEAELPAGQAGLVHLRDLLAAFRQDARQDTTASWADLMAYCRLSAMPVGRFLLDLHEESDACRPASDALCAALQVLNHIQDAGSDFRILRRCYVPADWLSAAGLAPETLASTQSTPALRNVFNRMLDETEKLMEQGRTLPGQIADFRLRLETGVVVRVAERQLVKLRRHDPLAQNLALRPWEKMICALSGVVLGVLS